MVKPTGISRRLMQCVTHLQSNDCEGALVNLFPAMNKTAKKRRPKDGVAKPNYKSLKHNNATGADGMKIAVLRKGRASLDFI
jgi:hypothetical protein